MKIVVIDAFSLIHRAYHAMPGFTTKTGESSGAIYGFCSMFLKMVNEFSPDGVVACFDLKEKTFRHELYSEYQAQRDSKPDDFYFQVERVKQFLEILGVKIISFSGYDADDAIGSVTEKIVRESKNEVVILSGDNDMLQLVKDRIRVFSLRKGITDTVVYDTEEVIKKYGFEPELLPDFKALSGDASDNIPGVSGIGPKTATNLIQIYGSLENIYKAAEKKKIKDSLAKKLLENKDKAFLFKYLATIRKDLNLDGYEFPFNKEKLNDIETIRFFEEFGFKSLLKRIGIEPVHDETSKIEKKLKQMTPEIFFKKVATFKKLFILSWQEQFIVSDGSNKAVFPANDFKTFSSEVFKNKNAEKIIFDFKSFLYKLDIFSHDKLFVSAPIYSGPIWDLKVLAWLADSGLQDYSLERISKRFLKKEISEGMEIESFIGIFNELSKISEAVRIYQEIEAPLTSILFQMEKNGIKLDEKILARFSQKLRKKISDLEKNIFILTKQEFNLNSPKELSGVLYGVLVLPTKGLKKLKSGYFSTDSESLEKIRKEHRVIDLILEWREFSKLMNTYVSVLPSFIDQRSKRLHTTFLQTGTSTGRLASESPNVQNIPKHVAWSDELRESFVSESDRSLMAFDYSQIELRLAASLSEDKNMVDAFLSGQDIHRKTASLIWNIPFEKVSKEQRFQAKALNFGVLYGMGSRSLAQTAGVSQEEARTFIDDYFHNFPGLKDYIDKTLNFLRENGYVETVFGRRRYLSGIYSGRPQLVAQAERMALNLTLQGLAADIIKKAMIKIDQEVLPKFQGKAKMILQIHDELLFEVKDEIIEKILPEIKEVMEGIYEASVPILVESHVGKNWAEVD